MFIDEKIEGCLLSKITQCLSTRTSSPDCSSAPLYFIKDFDKLALPYCISSGLVCKNVLYISFQKYMFCVVRLTNIF